MELYSPLYSNSLFKGVCVCVLPERKGSFLFYTKAMEQARGRKPESLALNKQWSSTETECNSVLKIKLAPAPLDAFLLWVSWAAYLQPPSPMHNRGSFKAPFIQLQGENVYDANPLRCSLRHVTLAWCPEHLQI